MVSDRRQANFRSLGEPLHRAKRREIARVHMGQPWLVDAIERYGYLAVLLAIAIESAGIPFPGETTLILAAVYAGTGGHLSIAGVIVAAATGAILGDNLGYTVGRKGG